MTAFDRLAWAFIALAAGTGSGVFIFRVCQALSGGVFIGRGIRWDRSVQAKRFWAGIVICLLFAPFAAFVALCALMMVFQR